MPVAIFGDRSCGKTVFLSLLYESQVRYSNDAENKGVGEYRFNTDPNFAKILGDIRTDLTTGQWADSTLKGNLSKYKFRYGYRKRLPGVSSPSSRFDILNFTVYDIAGEDLDILRSLDQYREAISTGQYKGDFNFDLLSESFKELLKCNVLVFLVDLSKINSEVRSQKYKEMRDYDVFMATLISAVSKFKESVYLNDKKKAKIYPVFVMTKFDLMDQKILSEQRLPAHFDPLNPKASKVSALFKGKKMDRESFAKEILARYYGDTMALSKGGALSNVSFDKAAYFFSEVITEQNEDGDSIPHMNVVAGRPQLDYSDMQYRDFIDRFREIAHDMPDAVLDDQEFEARK